MRRGLRSAGAVLVVATMGSGCSGGAPTAELLDEDAVISAVAASFAGSWSWSGRLDLELTDAHVDALAAFGGGEVFDADDDAVAAQVRMAVEEAARQRVHGALADDGSFRSAWRRGDADLVDVRFDFAEVLRAQSMTPEAGILVRVDVPGVFAFLEERQVFAGELGEALPSLDELRQQVRDLVDEADLRAVLLTILDGGFGGVVGQFDFAEVGVTEDQLDDVRAEFAERYIGEAAVQTFVEVAAEAFTVRDITTEGDVTRAVLDLHPRDATAAVYDLFDDAQYLAEDLADSYLLDEDLPETIEGVAQLTFDAAGNLTEVRTDVLSVAGQLATSMELDADATRLLAGLQGATIQVVFGFADHDAVDTVLDVEGTTMVWDDIVRFFAPDIEDVTG